MFKYKITNILMGFERIVENEFDLDNSYRKMKELSRKSEISMDSFSDLYGKESIDKDKQYVLSMKQKFAEKGENDNEVRMHKVADIFEGVFVHNIYNNLWLGENVDVMKCTKYDDYKNGVDGVVEYRMDETVSHMGFAIDVTTSNDLRRKLERTKHEIEEGKLAKVKYFQSDFLSIKRELSNLPRVIVSAETKTVLDLANATISKNNNYLAKHPFQFQILEEISGQLKVFRDYSSKIGNNNLADIYSRSLMIIERIKKEKASEVYDIGDRDNAGTNTDVFLSLIFK